MDGSGLSGAIRHRFPILERLTYLNSCSQGALSDDVRRAHESYLRDWDEQGSPWGYWAGQVEAARGAFAKLVNADADEVAVTTSVSAAANALASALRFDGRRPRSSSPITSSPPSARSGTRRRRAAPR